MKKSMKRILAGCMVVCMMFLAACSGKGEKDTKSSGKGRYIETEYSLPEDNVQALKKLNDGTLRAVCEKAAYDSKDNGQTWEKSSVQPSIYEDGEESNKYVEAIDGDGGIFYASYEDEQEKYFYEDPSGQIKTLDIEFPEMEMGEGLGGVQTFTMDGETDENGEAILGEVQGSGQSEGSRVTSEEADDTIDNAAEYNISNGVSGAAFDNSGNIILTDFTGNILQIDKETGKVLNTISTDAGYIEQFVCSGDKVYVSAGDKIEIYDMKTGNYVDEAKALNEYVGGKTGSTAVASFSGSSETLMAASEDGNSLYYCDEKGLYKYSIESDTLEQLIDGSINLISNNGYYFSELLEAGEEFLILYQNGQDYTSNLFNYKYDADAASAPEKELNVYALKDNLNVRQTISNFQTTHPEYKVNLEIGLSDGVKAEDAINTLNTSILAGNGPDVILLDGIPLDSYIETGMLKDIKDLVDEAAKNNEFFTDVLYNNETKDGLYAVPTRFGVPVVSGSKDILDGLESLQALADGAEQLRAEDSDIKSILGECSATELLQILYSVFSSDFIKEDGTLDQNKLEDFLAQAKRIYDVNGEPNDDEETFEDTAVDVVAASFSSIISKHQKMNLSILSGMFDYNAMLSANKKYDADYKLVSGQDQNAFVPYGTVGINSKTEDEDGSKEFVKLLLSAESQMIQQSPGFPVNKEAYNAIYQTMLEQGEQGEGEGMMMTESEDGTVDSLTVKNATEEEYKQLREQMEGLKDASVSNDIIRDAVEREGAKYLKGESEKSSAADNIIQKMNLYLSE